MSRSLYGVRLWVVAAFLFAGFATWFAAPAQAADDPLSLFKNYFVTGDEASAGAGMRGTGRLVTQAVNPLLPSGGQSLATARIQVDVPDPVNDDIVAAFLYWETIEKTAEPSSFKGYLLDPDPSLTAPPGTENGAPLNYPVAFYGRPIGAEHAAPCWSSGGSTGSSNGAPTLRVYRADVLRYLKISPATGKKVPVVTVQLPDSGSSGSTVPLTEGASLVVVYRDHSSPYRAVVIYDGSFTINNATDSLNQTIGGFYQTSATSPAARITYIVGDGQSNFPELLSFNGDLLASNPFQGQAGPSWDNLVYSVNVAANSTAAVTTAVTHGGGSFDCLSWGAIVFSVNVQDSDQDGLLDVWETQGYKDPVTGALLVNLPAMGANPTCKDLFVEIDYMKDSQASGASYHAVNGHLPKKEALDMVGDAFKNAPPLAPSNCPPGSDGIRPSVKVHFDVGNNYQTGPADPYIIPAALAEGGDIIDERTAHSQYCTPYDPDRCLFPDQPGLVSWKKGVRHIQQSKVPGSTKHYFNDARVDLFHYVVFAHALALPGDPLDGGGFKAKSVSGRADLPGGDLVVSLGLWRASDPADAGVGSKNLQASTLLHELAHTLWGYHGGTQDGLNCKPNQESVLNYLYQSAGLLDAAGRFRIDLSREALTASHSNDENELALQEFFGIGSGSMAYRLRWYANAAQVEASLSLPSGTITPATRHCNGTLLTAGEAGLVRVDGPNLLRSPIDWDSDGNSNTPALDINFNGDLGQTSADFGGISDWAHIAEFHGFQQLAARRSLFGLSVGVGSHDLLNKEEFGPGGEFDLGEFDLGEFDLGEFDLGEFDLGEFDLGEFDLGEFDLGEFDLGEFDLGEFDLGDQVTGDIDESIALSVGNPPSGLALVSRTNRTVTVKWDPPAAGVLTQYVVYRLTVGDAGSLKIFPPLTGTPPATTFTDTTIKNNESYVYYVIAGFDDGKNSSPSNLLSVPK